MNRYSRKHLRTKAFVFQEDVSNKSQLIWKILHWQSISDSSLLKKKKDIIKFTSERSVHGLVMGERIAGRMSPLILLINLNWGLVGGASFSTHNPPFPEAFAAKAFHLLTQTNVISPFHLPLFRMAC